ncbi:MAG: hypothetical protein HS116_15155 [Planctomycetes bacterium]|nr:hypothetical protein [Planctomycetota bacterium]
MTLGDTPREFEVDTTQRTGTVNSRGGWLTNTHATEAVFVDTLAGTTATTQPAGVGHLVIKPGKSMPLQNTCAAFTFKAGGTSYLLWTKGQPT